MQLGCKEHEARVVDVRRLIVFHMKHNESCRSFSKALMEPASES